MILIIHNYQVIHRKRKKRETPEEDKTDIPTTKAKATRQPKEPKNKSKDNCISLEATEYFDDQKP